MVAPHLVHGDPEQMGHPNQKPLSICEPHVRVLTSPGDVVLDPFAGSGSYVAAAKRLGRQAVGFEVDRERFEIARDRVARTHVQEELALEPEPRTKPLSRKDQQKLFD